ncbi:META domain-containing protein [Nocardioides sp. GXZ039]|uniref:META domain-containing protein n=1 Tax=Nocardioides sp. GXZ039 TaxID=3136018 RepID=UPI0030F4B349
MAIRRTRPLARLACVVTLVCLASGCADDRTDGRDDPDTIVEDEQTQLADRAFTTDVVTGGTLVPGSMIELSFDHGVMAARAGCNTLVGPYSDADGMLRWTSGPASTLQVCPSGGLDAQERWLADLLTTGMKMDSGPADLTLVSGAVRMELNEVPAPTPNGSNLLGTSWSLMTITEHETTALLPEGLDAPTLVFEVSGKVNITTGCNLAHSAVDPGSDTLVFEPPGTSRRACPSEEATRIERLILSTLDGEVDHEIDHTGLLVLSQGEQALAWAAAPA